MCLIVLVFPHCCLPLFHLEELFPCSAWKQAAGQQQVSLFLVVRSLGQPPFFFLSTMSQSTPIVQIMVCHQLFKSWGGFVFHILHFQFVFGMSFFSFLLSICQIWSGLICNLCCYQLLAILTFAALVISLTACYILWHFTRNYTRYECIIQHNKIVPFIGGTIVILLLDLLLRISL